MATAFVPTKAVVLFVLSLDELSVVLAPLVTREVMVILAWLKKSGVRPFS